MGWGRTLLLGDIGNRLDIEDCEKDIARFRSSLRLKGRIDEDQNRKITQLERENDELKLYLAALLRLLISKSVIETEDFSRFVNIIDTEDGTADNKTEGGIL